MTFRHSQSELSSAEVELSDAQADRGGVEAGAVVVEKPTPAPVITRRHTNRRMWAGVAAVALVGLAIAGFILIKRAPATAPPVTRAKTTLVRLTNNTAMDVRPVWSPANE